MYHKELLDFGNDLNCDDLLYTLCFNYIFDIDEYEKKLIINYLYENYTKINSEYQKVFNRYVSNNEFNSHSKKEYMSTFVDYYYTFNNLKLSKSQHELLLQLYKIYSGSTLYNFISAPTSFGKSKIISEFVISKYNKIVFIVPTKALINEMSNAIRSYNEKHNLNYYIAESHFDDLTKVDKYIFICTQERYNLSKEVDVDIVVVDEAQNISNISKDRTLELVFALKRMNCKSIFICPYLKLDNLIELYNKYFDFFNNYTKIEFTEKDSLISDRTYLVKPKKKKVEISINSINDSERESVIETNVNFSHDDFKLTELIHIINEFNFYNQKNLIYCGTITYCKKTNEFLKQFFPLIDLDHDICNLIYYFKDNYHDLYSSIDDLKRGIFLHNTSNDPFSRKYAEYLFNNGDKLNTIICTSTLLNGVNLNVFNLFYMKSRRNESEIETKNILGRSGRFGIRNIGNRFLLDRQNAQILETKEKLNRDINFKIPDLDINDQYILSDGRFEEGSKRHRIYRYYVNAEIYQQIYHSIRSMNKQEIKDIFINPYNFENLVVIMQIYYKESKEYSRCKFFALIFSEYLSGKSIKKLVNKNMKQGFCFEESNGKIIKYQKIGNGKIIEKKDGNEEIIDNKNDKRVINLLINYIMDNQTTYCEFKLKRVVRIVIYIINEYFEENLIDSEYNSEKMYEHEMVLEFDTNNIEKAKKIQYLNKLGIKDKYLVNEIIEDTSLYDEIMNSKKNIKDILEKRYGENNYRLFSVKHMI